MNRKADTISYKELNRLTDHTDTNHDPLPSEVLFGDENKNQLEEVLMGMEYDIEAEEEKELAAELMEEDEIDDDEDDYDSDLLADVDDEIDESMLMRNLGPTIAL